MFTFFSGGSNRQNPMLITLLSLILGIFLIRYPGMSGNLFCFALAASALTYAAIRLVRYQRSKKQGLYSPFDQYVGIFLLVVGLIILFFPRLILSFLPFTLGTLLFFAGFSKLPFVIDAFPSSYPLPAFHFDPHCTWRDHLDKSVWCHTPCDSIFRLKSRCQCSFRDYSGIFQSKQSFLSAKNTAYLYT